MALGIDVLLVHWAIAVLDRAVGELINGGLLLELSCCQLFDELPNVNRHVSFKAVPLNPLDKIIPNDGSNAMLASLRAGGIEPVKLKGVQVNRVMQVLPLQILWLLKIHVSFRKLLDAPWPPKSTPTWFNESYAMLAPNRAGGIAPLTNEIWVQSVPSQVQVSPRTLNWLKTPVGPRFKPPNITTEVPLPNWAIAAEILFGGVWLGNLW
jgi:hypothetical protein